MDGSIACWFDRKLPSLEFSPVLFPSDKCFLWRLKFMFSQKPICFSCFNFKFLSEFYFGRKHCCKIVEKARFESCSVQNQLLRFRMADPFYTTNIETTETETVLNYLWRMVASQVIWWWLVHSVSEIQGHSSCTSGSKSWSLQPASRADMELRSFSQIC